MLGMSSGWNVATPAVEGAAAFFDLAYFSEISRTWNPLTPSR